MYPVHKRNVQATAWKSYGRQNGKQDRTHAAHNQWERHLFFWNQRISTDVLIFILLLIKKKQNWNIRISKNSGKSKDQDQEKSHWSLMWQTDQKQTKYKIQRFCFCRLYFQSNFLSIEECQDEENSRYIVRHECFCYWYILFEWYFWKWTNKHVEFNH